MQQLVHVHLFMDKFKWVYMNNNKKECKEYAPPHPLGVPSSLTMMLCTCVIFLWSMEFHDSNSSFIC